MVSIPDWSRFGRLGEVQKEQPSLGARYSKQREAEAIKQAEESGYFLQVDRPFIEKHILVLDEEAEAKRQRAKSFLSDQQEDEIDLSGIQMVRLASARLRTVGDIGLCQNIRICVLSNNYIIRFDALVTCTHLIKLDLHSNQIQSLPTSAFWASKPFLRILNLHDNPIGRIENLHQLSSCPHLSVLTMYDTPLSLKRNYRHHVVNSIWSLKALDSYVISDEEIIEDAEFTGHFSCMHPNFSINLCPRLLQDATFEDEIVSVLDTLAEINHIMAHNSPVLIIQRFIRGHLTRKHFKFIAETRACQNDDGAAAKIQRSFRSWKGTDGAAAMTAMDMPPPPSPADGSRPKAPEASIESSRLDYDTYMQHRRPGSTGASEASRGPPQQQRDHLPLPAEKEDTEPDNMTHRLPGTPVSSEHGGRTHIYVNLAKLELGTLQSLHDEAIAIDSFGIPTDFSTSRDEKVKLGELSSRRAKKKKDSDAKKKRVIKSVKQFFGPVVDLSETPEPEEAMEKEDDEVPVINFRLKGAKQRIQLYDPTTDMIIGKRDAGRLVREAEYDFHRDLDMRPEPVIEQRSQPNAERRLFNRIQGTMGFSCLRAVEQAYKDRSKAEKKVEKMEYVLNMRDQREAAKERIRIFNEERRNKTMKEREKETKKTAEVLEKRELQRIGYIDRSVELRNKSSHHTKHRKGELTFISDFNAQNTSVSNALLRHDRLARKEDKLQATSELVQGYKSTELDQKEIVRKYMEHRQLMRQTESALSRAALDTRMLQEANDTLMQAKARVAQQKARSKTAETLHPLPASTNIVLPPVSDQQRKLGRGLDRWGTSVLISNSSPRNALKLPPATAAT